MVTGTRNLQNHSDYAACIAVVQRYICDHMDEPLNREVLAAMANFSIPHFHRIFTGCVGENVASYVRRVRLERAKAQMLARQLPAAHADLKALVEELKDGGTDGVLLTEAREALANSQYYMTWLMRLEGQPRDLWEPEIESARQTYRLLAERASAQGDDTAAKKNREDLEASVRLARMDLGEFQGLPLPSQ